MIITFQNKAYTGPDAGVVQGHVDFELDKMSVPNLLTLYNLVSSNLGKGRVNRFSDSKAAVRRTWAVLQEYAKDFEASEEELKAQTVRPVAEAPVVSAPVVELTPADEKQIADEAQSRAQLTTTLVEAVEKPKVERKKRGMRFVFPVGDEIKPVRPGTHRATLLTLFSSTNGATFEEAMAATWGTDPNMDEETQRKTTYEGIRLLHYYVGWGMSQDAEGRIKVKK